VTFTDPESPATVLNLAAVGGAPIAVGDLSVYVIPSDRANPDVNLLLLVSSGGTTMAIDDTGLGQFYDWLTTLIDTTAGAAPDTEPAGAAPADPIASESSESTESEAHA
jgi:hypothetical protein